MFGIRKLMKTAAEHFKDNNIKYNRESQEYLIYHSNETILITFLPPSLVLRFC
jgi:hypothetical protein